MSNEEQFLESWQKRQLEEALARPERSTPTKNDGIITYTVEYVVKAGNIYWLGQRAKKSWETRSRKK